MKEPQPWLLRQGLPCLSSQGCGSFIAANDARCQALGWSCIPLAVEIFGNWGREAQGVFSRLATLLALHQGRPKSTVVRDIYGHLSISLVRSVARSIMGREIVN